MISEKRGGETDKEKYKERDSQTLQEEGYAFMHWSVKSLVKRKDWSE